MFRVSGTDDSYRGWLARIFNFPQDKGQSPEWQSGCDAAEDCPSLVALAAMFAAGVHDGHLKIEKGECKCDE